MPTAVVGSSSAAWKRGMPEDCPLRALTRSVCETTPMTRPLWSTTGAPLMQRSVKTFASSEKKTARQAVHRKYAALLKEARAKIQAERSRRREEMKGKRNQILRLRVT